MDLLDNTISPPASAYKAEPFTVAEMDAHPDRDRIWATLLALRAEHEAAVEALDDYISANTGYV